MQIVHYACYSVAYPLTELVPTRQNQLEEIFLPTMEESLPPHVTFVWIAERGYCRCSLLEQSVREGSLYIIRAHSGTIIIYQARGMELGQLTCKPCTLTRYNGVLYHATRQIRVDVITYYEPHYNDPWYLGVPMSVRALMSSDVVVELYRERIQIEQGFRDFKTHLGMRDLRLRVDVTARMGRLVLAFCLADVLGVLLGESTLGYQARAACDIPRCARCYTTSRTLSALITAMLMLSEPDWVHQSLLLLHKLIRDAATGRSWLPMPQIPLHTTQNKNGGEQGDLPCLMYCTLRSRKMCAGSGVVQTETRRTRYR